MFRRVHPHPAACSALHQILRFGRAWRKDEQRPGGARRRRAQVLRAYWTATDVRRAAQRTRRWHWMLG